MQSDECIVLLVKMCLSFFELVSDGVTSSKSLNASNTHSSYSFSSIYYCCCKHTNEKPNQQMRNTMRNEIFYILSTFTECQRRTKKIGMEVVGEL